MNGHEKELGRYTEVDTLEQAENLAKKWMEQRNKSGEGKKFTVKFGACPGGYFVNEGRKI